MSPRQVDAERRRLLEAMLTHVAFDGWSATALRAAGQDVGLDSAQVANAFPRGPAEALETFSAEADRRMLQALEQHDLSAMRLRERVALAVRLRLQQSEQDREAVRRGLAFLALPQHAGLAARCLYRTVDAVWHGAGDTSTDYNFYTKRLLLAGVYSATVLAWLDDTSEDRAETWAFLERRIDEALRVGGRLGGAVRGLLDLPDRLAGVRPQRPQ